jgi:Fe-S cluster assembly ATP-binding protein
MLKIQNLTVAVEEKIIVRDISLEFLPGKTYFLLGKNGSGKSSLAFSLMGHPKYRITTGEIIVDSLDVTKSTPDIRANAGLFLSFQHVPEIK